MTGIDCELTSGIDGDTGAAVGTGGDAARGSGVGLGCVDAGAAVVGLFRKRYFEGRRSSDGVSSATAGCFGARSGGAGGCAEG